MRHHRPRLAPTLYLGHRRYSLTFCTDGRRTVFGDKTTVGLVYSQILRAAREHEFTIVAYCFMPDHLHLVVEGHSPDSSLPRFVHAAKQYSAFTYARSATTRLWQHSYYEHVLRDNESTYRTVRYIFENPIRAGLVRRVDDYPFLGSEVVMLDETPESTD